MRIALMQCEAPPHGPLARRRGGMIGGAMPTMSYYRLEVTGPAAALEAVRGDRRVWHMEPWAGFFGGPQRREDDPRAGRLVYVWADDYKRPGPSVADIAAAYPQLTFVLEYADETGAVAGRAHYANGANVRSRRVDPGELEWMEWDDDDEDD